MPSLAGLFFWMNRKIENINKITVTKPLELDCGKTIKDFPLAYETYGKPKLHYLYSHSCLLYTSPSPRDRG